LLTADSCAVSTEEGRLPLLAERQHRGHCCISGLLLPFSSLHSPLNPSNPPLLSTHAPRLAHRLLRQ
ncbi:hypothetical protein CCH79_00005777, partial [Gambusia affinis]